MTPAALRFGKFLHLEQLLLHYRRLLRVLVDCDKTQEFHYISGGIEKYGVASESVTSCTPRFLVVPFHILGYVIMYHVPDIGFVDTHAKGYSGHDDLYLIALESFLHTRSFGAGHAGVIVFCQIAHIRELFHYVFRAGTRKCIYYAAVIFVPVNVIGELFYCLTFWPDVITDIGPVETRNEFRGVIQL